MTFGYDPGRPVLTDVSFVVEPGQLVGLVGPSGSGKSTLVSLIPRFYDPDSGAVTIDGSDVRDFTIRSLRRQIGFVLQDTQLFYAPIWQNIAYGQPDATRDADHRRGAARAGARVHRGAARRLRHDGRAGRAHAVRRTAAAAGHRAGDGAGRARF